MYDQALKNIRSRILKNKVQLGFILNINSKYDKYYKYGQYIIMSLVPAISFAQTQISEQNLSSTSTVILGSIAIALLKIKDYMTFDKISDMCRRQIVRYSSLYERIEVELIKAEENKQDMDDFIFWVNRELSQIKLDDPDISYDHNVKYQTYCEKHNIPFDDDLIELKSILVVPNNDIASLRIKKMQNEQATQENNYKEKIKSQSTIQDLSLARERFDDIFNEKN